MTDNLPITVLTSCDYYRGYLQLLEQLTVVNADSITYEQFNQLCNSEYGPQAYIIRNETGNRVIASGSMVIEQKFIHNLSKVAHIEDIVVDREYSGRGLGRKLVQYLINEARDAGCYKVILDCDESVVGFYERCGLHRKGVQMAQYFDA